jgi:hypothetical protein
MKKLTAILGSLALLAAVSTSMLVTGCKHTDSDERSEHMTKYTCKMHPEVMQDTSGTCPKCGMKLTKVRE